MNAFRSYSESLRAASRVILKGRSDVSTPLLAGVICGVLWTCGCRTPDIKPFHESTLSIQEAVSTAQVRFVDEMRSLANGFELNSTQQNLKGGIARFTNAWDARIEVTDALADYAQSLAVLSEAPSKARRNSEALARSFLSLTSTFNAYSAAAQTGAALALEVESIVNHLRANHQLRHAVEVTDDAVQHVAKQLAADFRSLSSHLRALDEDLENLLRSDFGRRLDVRATLDAKLQSKLETLHQALDTPKWLDAVEDFSLAQSRVNRFLEEDQRWTAPYFQRVKETRARLQGDLRLLKAAENGLREWAKAHGKLREAQNSRMEPDWTRLIRSAENIDKAIKTLATHGH